MILLLKYNEEMFVKYGWNVEETLLKIYNHKLNSLGYHKPFTYLSNNKVSYGSRFTLLSTDLPLHFKFLDLWIDTVTDTHGEGGHYSADGLLGARFQRGLPTPPPFCPDKFNRNYNTTHKKKLWDGEERNGTGSIRIVQVMGNC